MLNKHAYLILAHNNFGVLEKLIKMLDYKHNPILLLTSHKNPTLAQLCLKFREENTFQTA